MIYVKENSMETLKIFGERLRALRDERHLRQADMAEVLQITLVHYQRMEYGKVNVPSLTLCFLADYFSVTTDYLLGRSDGLDIRIRGAVPDGVDEYHAGRV